MATLSTSFARRLEALPPSQRVRVIVLLDVSQAVKTDRGRRTSADRSRAVESVRMQASEGLREVDQILKRCGGKRTAEQPDALGSLPVETTPAGVKALAALPVVNAVLEDQPISHVTR